MSKKKLAKKIIIPVVLVVLIATAIIIFAVNKKPKTNTPNVSIVTHDNQNIELEIQDAVLNHNVSKEFNGNYVYKSIKDVSFANEISDSDKALTFKYLTGRPDENAFRLYLNNKKTSESENEILTFIEGQYTKTTNGTKTSEGFYYGNLNRSYVYVEDPNGSIEIEENKYSIEIEISQTAYWLNKSIVTSPTIIYVREKYVYDELASNFMYITYAYEMINL